jgi:hypothetical protein
VYGIRDLLRGHRNQTRDQVVREVKSLIYKTVGDPLDWVENGGTVSSLCELNGVLVVKAPAGNQRALGLLLEQLRQGRGLPAVDPLPPAMRR